MKEVTWGLVIALTSAFMLWVAGCADNDEETVTSDREALHQLMREDLDLEQADAFGSDDDMGPGPLDDPINPIRWGRFGHRDLISVNVDIVGDTFATITRTLSFDGDFKVVDGVNDSTQVLYTKSMHNTIVRKAHAIRVGRTRDPHRNWRITEVTPAVLMSAAPEPHTIDPAQVQIFRATGSGPMLVVDITDPLNTYFNRQNLPAVFPGDSLFVYATATTLSPAAAFLHPHVYRYGHLRRLPLKDDGVWPDVTANDGIYSALYTTAPRLGVHMSGIDFLDYETLYDSHAPYDAGAWAIPYQVAQ